MNMNDYQKLSGNFDQVPQDDGKLAKGIDGSLIVPLLGLAGESGTLLTEFKKQIRDGESYRLFPDQVKEELGDILWYVSNIATKMGFHLSDVAEGNLKKIGGRWRPQDAQPLLPNFRGANFDSEYPVKEQLPKRFKAYIDQVGSPENYKAHVEIDGQPYGQVLTDNAYTSDGYRFHDVFHIAYMALLNWSPVSRRNLELKRRSDKRTDEIEDGGRAIVIEEGISALVFQYASGRSFLENASGVDYEILALIKRMSSHLEVSACSMAMWEYAILEGYRIWRDVHANQGGIVQFDGESLTYTAKTGSAN